MQGWSAVDAIDMNEFYQHFVSDEEKDFVERLEQFDEFEVFVSILPLRRLQFVTLVYLAFHQ